MPRNDDEPETEEDLDATSADFRRQIITIAVIVAAYFFLRWLGVLPPAHVPAPW